MFRWLARALYRGYAALMAHQQERSRGVIRVILEQDVGFTAWLSDQFGAIGKRFNQLESSMKTLEDYIAAIKAAQDETASHLANIKGDVAKLLAAVAAVPTNGLTPEQVTALDDVVARGQAVVRSAEAVDALSPIPAPSPAPAAEPAPAAAAEPPVASSEPPPVEPAPATTPVP